jgi:glycosyltransferase involved in cell wall biosynthesis
MSSYNHERFVGQTIESVLSQSFSDFEFVIVDDGSSDGTAEVIRSYTDSRINFQALAENVGACQATNYCISRTSGDYIALINSDDTFLPGKLARQVEELDNDIALGALFGLAEFVDERGEPKAPETNPFANVFTAAPADRFQWLRHFFLFGNAICHPTLMIRRRIYADVGLYNVLLRQLPDLDMWIRICAHHPIRVLDQPLVAFRVLDGQRNTSAPTLETARRSEWEESRVLRRYRHIDEATLRQAFAGDIPAHVAEQGLPMWVQLAHLAAARSKPSLQLLALEMLEEAAAKDLGVSVKALHQLTGQLDPFRLGEVNKLRRRLAAPKG